MTDPVCPTSVADINLFHPDAQNCPYPSYRLLRDEAPVWKDPISGAYYVTRYDLLRQMLLDTENFASAFTREDVAADLGRARRMMSLYEEKGWVPAPTLAQMDEPKHRAVRKLFEQAFRASKIKSLDPFTEATANALFDAFIEDGHCEWVRQFAVPLPLTVIMKQTGADMADMWRIKAWTDAFARRLGLMQSEEEERQSVEMEIEQQHYFQPIFERLRREPDGTLLSDLVNTEIPELGRTLTDQELHAEMSADTFVGGSETTTNALAAGVRLLLEHPNVWARLKSDPEKYLRGFVEEVLRLESPVQSLFRRAARDVELGGVTIPKGAIIFPRYGAANRDERHFENPDELDLDRANAATHLAFGSGSHHCLGAPLARRELYFGFKVLVERFEDFWAAEGRNDYRHLPNVCLRSLRALHIEFKRK